MIRFYSIISLYLVTCMAFAKPASKAFSTQPIIKGTNYFRPFVMDEMKQFFFADESHDFRTFDTTISAGYSGITWRLRISMPLNYFTANHADTASRPLIFTIPGQGEMGTSYSTLATWGPFREINRGWDGGVQLGNGRHFPILVTAISSNTFMNGKEAGDLLARLYYWLHPKFIATAGLSQGAFATSAMMLIDTCAAKVKAFACFHGRSNEYTVSTTPAETEWGRWAKKYDIRFFGLEGNAGDNFREVWRISNRIHDSIPGNAYFSYTSVASGGHGGWDTIYSVYQNRWRSVTPFGTYNTASQGANGIDRMGTYIDYSNIYQWMLRQGDTSIVGSSSTSARKVVGVAVSEYKNAFHYNDSTVWSYTNGTYQKYDLGARKVVKVATGFNTIQMLDDQGYVWSSVIPTGGGPATNIPVRVDTDTTGAAFNNNIAIFGCGAVGGGNIRPTFCSIRTDSSVWYWGHNNYNFFGGARPIKPIQLSPVGMKFKKIAMSYYRILGLTTAGDVYEWSINGSTTPTQKTLPRPAIDIDAPYFDAAVAIVPKATGSQTMGYPFWWGNAFSMWGGVSGTSTPTERWSLTVPIKEIGCGYHTTHYIDSLNRMFGIGENAQGEIGIGTSIVDRYTYPTPWRWSYNTGESMVTTPTQVGIGVNWKNLWKDVTLSFYGYAQDVNDSIYFCGRDKAYVGGRGFLVLQEESYPNTIDVKSWTMVTPGRVTQSYNFTPGTANAGPDNSTNGTTITLDATATASTILANGTVNNGISSLSPSVIQYNWSQVSGPSCTISTANQATTGITGMNTVGVYTFRVQVTLSDGSIVSDVLAITKNASAGQLPFRTVMPKAGRLRRAF